MFGRMCDRLARRSVQLDNDASVRATRPQTTATAVDISLSPGQSDIYVSVQKVGYSHTRHEL